VGWGPFIGRAHPRGKRPAGRAARYARPAGVCLASRPPSGKEAALNGPQIRPWGEVLKLLSAEEEEIQPLQYRPFPVRRRLARPYCRGRFGEERLKLAPLRRAPSLASHWLAPRTIPSALDMAVPRSGWRSSARPNRPPLGHRIAVDYSSRSATLILLAAAVVAATHVLLDGSLSSYWFKGSLKK
jgi:hypothetical protein